MMNALHAVHASMNVRLTQFRKVISIRLILTFVQIVVPVQKSVLQTQFILQSKSDIIKKKPDVQYVRLFFILTQSVICCANLGICRQTIYYYLLKWPLLPLQNDLA